LAMHEDPTTVVIQRYLEALPGDTATDPVVRELLERAVGRLHLLCAICQEPPITDWRPCFSSRPVLGGPKSVHAASF